RYQQGAEAYQPPHFVQDMLDQEILVRPDYRSRILEVLRSPDVTEENRQAVTLLAAFPSGLRNEVVHELGVEEALRPLTRSGGLVHRSAFAMGLRALRRDAEALPEAELIRQMIEEIDGEYAPDRRTFKNALSAFVSQVMPLVFPKRKGQQLVGWQTVYPLTEAGRGVRLGTMIGSFEQTARRFPQRAAIVVASGADAAPGEVGGPDLDGESGPQQYDLLFDFKLLWDAAQQSPAEPAEIKTPSDFENPIIVRLHMDLRAGAVRQEYIGEFVGAERMT
ncbi:unnamed protein product, partial [marine sediment metagenome]